MRILLTGGAGLLGRAIAIHFLERGHEVHLTDIVPETDVPNTTYAVCDIMDFASVQEQIRGCDAVVHMAALRNPFYGPGQDIYRINTVGTFNIFEAAAKAGIQRVVHASSINAIGCAWNTTDFTPQYLPIDEDHPLLTNDPYSFSKQQAEEIGAYFWRRDGIASIALRLPGVYHINKQEINHEWAIRRQTMRIFLGDFARLPETEQHVQMDIVRHHCLTYRAERRLEYPIGKWETPDIQGVNEHLIRAYMFDRFNLWASLDDRDAARAVELSLTAPLTGNHNLFVNDAHNSLGYDSQTLARLFFPNTPWKQTLNGSESLVTIQRARDVIGFEPQYSLIGE